MLSPGNDPWCDFIFMLQIVGIKNHWDSSWVEADHFELNKTYWPQWLVIMVDVSVGAGSAQNAIPSACFSDYFKKVW